MLMLLYIVLGVLFILWIAVIASSSGSETYNDSSCKDDISNGSDDEYYDFFAKSGNKKRVHFDSIDGNEYDFDDEEGEDEAWLK